MKDAGYGYPPGQDGLVLSYSADGKETAAGRKKANEEKGPIARLAPDPGIVSTKRGRATPDEQQRIQALITRLAEIDSPNFGLSGTLGGTAFAPIPGSEQAGALLLTDPGIKVSKPFLELVKLGPKALPQLLDALSDSTPTKLVMSAAKFIGWIQFSTEGGSNPANHRETAILARLPGSGLSLDDIRSDESHTITVGDVCFAIIGQITGRGYEASRYQPTGGIIINSPTRIPELAKAIRDVWKSDDPHEALFKSLLLDFRTRGIHKGEAFDHWYQGAEWQIGAAMRLLYYYPDETAKLIAARLDGLDLRTVHAEKPNDQKALDLWSERVLKNEVRADEFVKSVAWCRAPEVVTALRSVFERAEDAEVLAAALPALSESDWPLIVARAEPALQADRNDEGGWYGEGYKLLEALHPILGVRAKPPFVNYIRNGSVQRCSTVCEVLQEASGEWDKAVLIRLLSDRRANKDYAHPASPTDRENTVQIRVCDLAAAALAARDKSIKFEMVGTTKELDRKIGAIRRHYRKR